MKLIREHLPFLQLLTLTSPMQRKAMLSTLSTSQLVVLCEILLNLLKGNFTITNHYKNQLKRHKGLIRALVDKQVAHGTKKALLKGQGSVIAKILKPLIPKLSELVQ